MCGRRGGFPLGYASRLADENLARHASIPKGYVRQRSSDLTDRPFVSVACALHYTPLLLVHSHSSLYIPFAQAAQA